MFAMGLDDELIGVGFRRNGSCESGSKELRELRWEVQLRVEQGPAGIDPSH